MPAKILQITFKLNVPRAEFEDIARSLVSDFAQLPGLTWKIWLMKEPANSGKQILNSIMKSTKNTKCRKNC